MAAQTPPQSALREFCPLYYLLNAIPAKVQKGFRSVMVYLTALDTNSDYIAVGSSIGMLYLYCRRVRQINKYSIEGKSEAITAVKLLSCFDDLVAVGTAFGRVAVFQLVSQLPGRNKQLRRFDVVGLHKSTVTALAWSANGMKLFSGDDNGKVVYSTVDLDQGVCNPVLLFEELSAIVQLEYSQKVLLISSYQRSLLFYTQEQTLQQLGTKPRKSNGKFGACFQPGLCKQSDLLVYAARPGLRLWRTDVRGLVVDTLVLKRLFNQEVPQFELFARPGPTGGCRPHERQLGVVSCFLREGWVLSWNEYSVYVLDCLNQVIIGALESCGDIISVSCTENEIFILKGDRDIVRISNAPEDLASNISELSFHLTSPLTTPTILLPPTGWTVSTEPIRTMAIITEQGERERLVDEEVEEVLEQDQLSNTPEAGKAGALMERPEVGERLDHQRGGSVRGTSDFHSRSSSITSCDSVQGMMLSTSTMEQSELSSSQYSAINQEDFQHELVVQAIKVKKKAKRRRQESGNRIGEQHNSWSESIYSQDGGGGSDGGTSTSISEPPSASDHTSFPCSSLDLQCRSSGSLDQEGSISGGSPELTTSGAQSEGGDQREDPLTQTQPPGTQPPSCPMSLPSQDMECQSYPENGNSPSVNNKEGETPTRHVDLLLECTFAYMQTSKEQDPMEEQEDDLLSPLIGPDDLDQDDPHHQHCLLDLEPPSCVDQMRYSLEPEQCPSSDEEDIYAVHGVPYSASSASLGDRLNALNLQGSNIGQQDQDNTLAESWMGYTGPGCGILNLVVTDQYIWCLDFKGGLYCSALPDRGLSWQKFEDNVQQVALSPSGSLLWKVEQKTMTAYACGKVTIKGKRHWYKALEDSAFVALGEDTAWIIRTSGDLYLQTGLSVDRPCARAVKVNCPCPMAQIVAHGGVVWALSQHRAVFYRDGLSSYCSEGEMWKFDKISESQGLEPICIALGENNTAWALDTSGSLWFRTGVTARKPQGEDDHWWQVSITDYVVFDQGSLFQTLIQATQNMAIATKAPVERVAECLRMAFLSQQFQCQPILVSSNTSGVWIAPGRNNFHVAKGSLSGMFWQGVVPRGTVSATKWAFVYSSAVLSKEGSFLWLGQSRKDLFCVWDQDGQMHPTTVQLPQDTEMVQLSACRDALWGLDQHGRVHIRTLSTSCPTGMHWNLLDLSQLDQVRLVSVSCGSQNVWACDGCGMVYFRVGTQPFNPSMMLPAWICIEPPEQPLGVHFTRIHTSPNDSMLWAMDNRGNIHVRMGITDEMPVGTDWEHIPGLQASQLVLSVKTVWVRCPNGEVARRYGITDKNPAGDYWKKIPGLLNWLTVTPMDELWAVSVSGGLRHRLTKTLVHNTVNSHVNTGSLRGEDLEEEWEVI
ncbi:tectonin beta-propeller repeat-containing protein 2 isoform X1 [Salmo trutta]|uniref:tectonin beta-propeller repeat-containing protein 2 isoform X1 n=1 Tax=Salmo trutta TaxID=8032 RepID=UPI001130A0B8|nr:tectonin beta-propeller repeat-containing protein 2-like isoform X1 [Salmo trutta]XP_029568932.1 tectonin beta-propeller repeat-containing protein 2-like isoform X1 [Salmo trutta]